LFAFITKPSNLSSPVFLGFGFTALMMIGAAVSATTIGTVIGSWALAGAEKTPEAASISGSPSPAVLAKLFIRRHPWQSAATSKTARPGASWPAAGLASCHCLRRMVLDPPEFAETPGTGGPASSASPRLLPQLRRASPARWSRPASARYRTRARALRQWHP